MRINTGGALLPVLGVLGLGAAKLVVSHGVVPNYPALLLLEFAAVLFAAAFVFGTQTVLTLVALLSVGSLIAAVRILPSLRFDHPLTLDIAYVVASLQGFVVLAGCSLRCDLSGSGAVTAAVVAHHWVSYSGSAGGGYVLSLLLSVVSVLLVLSLRLFRLVDAQRSEAVASRDREAELNRRLASVTATLVEDKRRESMSLLAASLAHEVNNPLNYMSGNLRFAEEHIRAIREECRENGEGNHSRVEESLEDISHILSQFHSGFARIGDVVTGLKTLSRSRRGLEPTTDVAATCRRVVSAIGGASSNRIDFCLEIETGIRVACDAADLFTVFANLLTNAVEAIADTGCIEICAVRQNGDVRIEICDSGVGIPDDQTETVFEPFFTSKGQASVSMSSDHLGVGLSLCRSIAERVGGTIAITGKEGKSTCVTLMLPGTPTGDDGTSATL